MKLMSSLNMYSFCTQTFSQCTVLKEEPVQIVRAQWCNVEQVKIKYSSFFFGFQSLNFNFPLHHNEFDAR